MKHEKLTLTLWKRFFSILLLLVSTNFTFSQNFLSEKRIYLLDVTASMEGKDDEGAINIFADVKEKLSKAVLNIEAPNGEVVVIPFTSKPHKSFSGSFDKKDSIASLIENVHVMRGETNISAAWEKGVQELDSTKINYLFLLTDGIHNYGTPKDYLLSLLEQWKDLSKEKYYFGFYVMLTPNARDNDIAKVIDSTPQMWCIESMDVMASFVALPFIMHTNANIPGEKEFTFTPISRFKTEDPGVKVLLEENPFYSLEKGSIDLGKGEFNFELKEKMEHSKTPLTTDLNFRFEYDKEKYPLLFFTPEEVTLKAINRGTRSMNIRILE